MTASTSHLPENESPHMLELRPAEPGAQGIRVNWTMAAVVIALVTQTGALIAWGARMDERVAALEEKISAAEKLSDTVARVDERTKAMQDTVNRLDARLTDSKR